MDKYIPLDPNGFQHAQKLGYIEKFDPPNGNLCLECGCIVGSRAMHDAWHFYFEAIGDGQSN